MKTCLVPPRGYHLVFCRSFRHYRTGRVIRAKDHGKKFFAFIVRDK